MVKESMMMKPRLYNGKRTFSSINGADKTGQLCGKKIEIILFFNTIHKNKLKMD